MPDLRVELEYLDFPFAGDTPENNDMATERVAAAGGERPGES